MLKDDFIDAAGHFVDPFHIDTPSGPLNGHIRDRVLQLNSGQLAFITQLFIDGMPSDTTGIQQAIRSTFARFATVEAEFLDIDVIQSFAPSEAGRSGTGSDVTFKFATPITASPNGLPVDEWASNPLVVITDFAPIEKVGLFSAGGINNGLPLSDPILVWTAVPEPQTWVMLLAAVFALPVMRRKLRRR